MESEKPASREAAECRAEEAFGLEAGKVTDNDREMIEVTRASNP